MRYGGFDQPSNSHFKTAVMPVVSGMEWLGAERPQGCFLQARFSGLILTGRSDGETNFRIADNTAIALSGPEADCANCRVRWR